MKYLPLLALACWLVSCTPEPDSSSKEDTKPSSMTREKRPTGSYTGHLVSKPFVNKAGRTSGQEDLYLRLGMGDFFIKFSESNVTASELRPLVDQVIEVEGEIRDGDWDIGPNDPPEMQSRIGSYFVITKLLND